LTSSSARQLELRLGQSVIWPSLGLRLRRQRRKEHEPVSNLAPRYVALYNGVWLVLNDIILGQTLGFWLCENHELIANLISYNLRPVLVEGMIDTLVWLDNWPAGLKLNTQLSHFFRDFFTGLTMAWNESVITYLIANDGLVLSRLIYFVGLSSRFMGLTMLLSVIVDLLQLFTLHWTLFFRIQQTIFRFFASSIVSLFYLFRGKKRNPLRKNRTDTATYDLDQLLLGTIFFTLFVFLFLTVAVYYLHFSLLRLFVVGIITLLQTGLAVLNHLPLFALMLRIKEPDRLPGGIELRLCKEEVGAQNPLCCSYYELHNTPLEIKDIFRGYNGHLQAIRDLPILLCKLLLGRRF
jgi:phosphatidylinositol glycan class Q protein